MVVNRSAATGENFALVASLSSEVVDPSSSESELTSSLDSDAGAGCGATVDSRFRAAHAAVNDMAPARLSAAAVTNLVVTGGASDCSPEGRWFCQGVGPSHEREGRAHCTVRAFTNIKVHCHCQTAPHNARTTFKTCLGQKRGATNGKQNSATRWLHLGHVYGMRVQNWRTSPKSALDLGYLSQNCERASWPRSNALARVLLLRGCPPCEQGRQALSPDCRGVGPCRALSGHCRATVGPLSA